MPTYAYRSLVPASGDPVCLRHHLICRQTWCDTRRRQTIYLVDFEKEMTAERIAFPQSHVAPTHAKRPRGDVAYVGQVCVFRLGCRDSYVVWRKSSHEIFAATERIFADCVSRCRSSVKLSARKYRPASWMPLVALNVSVVRVVPVTQSSV